jgi:AcrR family transcriptional regulator
MAPMRADARRNRERILAVARDALASDPDTSLKAIVARAGIGPGTLYRHFATRDELIRTIYDDDVQSLVAAVPALLATHAPLDALRLWLQGLAADVRVKPGLGEALHTAASQPVGNEIYGPVIAALGELLAAAEAAGAVRPGLDPADLLLVVGSLWRLRDGQEDGQRSDRVVDLVLTGL